MRTRKTSFVVVALLATVLVAITGCSNPVAPTEKAKSPEPVIINVTPVTLGVAPAFPRVHDTVVFSWPTPVVSAVFDVCHAGKCVLATVATDGKSAQFNPDEAGDWIGTLRRQVATPDLSATLATTKVVVSP